MDQDELVFQKALLKNNLITPEQLSACIKLQNDGDTRRPLIYYMIEKGYVNDDNLQHVVALQKNYFENLFKPAPPSVNATVAEPAKMIFGCVHCNKNFHIRNYNPKKSYFCPRCHGKLQKNNSLPVKPQPAEPSCDLKLLDPLDESQEISRMMDSIEIMLFNEKDLGEWWEKMDDEDKEVWQQLATDERPAPKPCQVESAKRQVKKKTTVAKRSATSKQPPCKENLSYKHAPREIFPTELASAQLTSQASTTRPNNNVRLYILLIIVSLFAFVVGRQSADNSENIEMNHALLLDSIYRQAQFTGEYQKAWQRLQSLSTQDWLWLRTAAEMKYLLGKYSDSKSLFEESLSIQKNGRSYVGLGKNMEKLGYSCKKCLIIYQKALKLEPTNKEARLCYKSLK